MSCWSCCEQRLLCLLPPLWPPFGVRECLWPESLRVCVSVCVCVEAHIFLLFYEIPTDAYRLYSVEAACFALLLFLSFIRSFVRSLNKNKRCVCLFAGSTDGCLKGQRNIDIASLKASKDHGNAVPPPSPPPLSALLSFDDFEKEIEPKFHTRVHTLPLSIRIRYNLV